MKLSLVIPVYNEEKKIEMCAKNLSAYLKQNFDEYEILFVNDGSVDSTHEKLERICRDYPNVKNVGYTKNRGKGYAVRTGMLESQGDFVLFTDCDLAYGTDVIKKAYERFCQGDCDIVIGSRNIAKDSYEGYTIIRKIMSKMYFRLVAFVSGFSHSDSQCGFKGFSKEAAKKVFPECKIDSYAFDLEALMIAEKKGFEICEIPVKIVNHDEEDSKVSPIKDTLKMLSDIRKIKKSLSEK